jgi:hypothetical protein
MQLRPAGTDGGAFPTVATSSANSIECCFVLPILMADP